MRHWELADTLTIQVGSSDSASRTLGPACRLLYSTVRLNVNVFTILPVPLVGTVEVPLGLPVNVTVTVLVPTGVTTVAPLAPLQPCSSEAAPSIVMIPATIRNALPALNRCRLRANASNAIPPSGSNQDATVVAGAVSVCRVRVTV